jgi:hypothetical protein
MDIMNIDIEKQDLRMWNGFNSFRIESGEGFDVGVGSIWSVFESSLSIRFINLFCRFTYIIMLSFIISCCLFLLMTIS